MPIIAIDLSHGVNGHDMKELIRGHYLEAGGVKIASYGPDGRFDRNIAYLGFTVEAHSATLLDAAVKKLLAVLPNASISKD